MGIDFIHPRMSRLMAVALTTGTVVLAVHLYRHAQIPVPGAVLSLVVIFWAWKEGVAGGLVSAALSILMPWPELRAVIIALWGTVLSTLFANRPPPVKLISAATAGGGQFRGLWMVPAPQWGTIEKAGQVPEAGGL